MKKNTTMLIVIIIIIIGIIALINFLKGEDKITEETARCIASKSQLFVSKNCGHCEQQKEILSNYLSLFNITDCIDEPEKCKEIYIQAVPTWVINGKQYVGAKSLNELKSLAGC